MPPPPSQSFCLIVCTLKVHLFIMQQPPHLTLTLHDMSKPLSTKISHPHHHSPLPPISSHNIHHSWSRSDQLCFPPLSAWGRSCCYYPNLNLIPNTFLKATFTMSIPPYLIDLIHPSEDMVTYLDLVQLSYHPPPRVKKRWSRDGDKKETSPLQPCIVHITSIK
jgi:hypothetical protein